MPTQIRLSHEAFVTLSCSSRWQSRCSYQASKLLSIRQMCSLRTPYLSFRSGINATTQYEQMCQASHCRGVGMATYRVNGSRFPPYEKLRNEIRLKHDSPLPLMKREPGEPSFVPGGIHLGFAHRDPQGPRQGSRQSIVWDGDLLLRMY